MIRLMPIAMAGALIMGQATTDPMVEKFGVAGILISLTLTLYWMERRDRVKAQEQDRADRMSAQDELKQLLTKSIEATQANATAFDKLKDEIHSRPCQKGCQ